MNRWAHIYLFDQWITCRLSLSTFSTLPSRPKRKSTSLSASYNRQTPTSWMSSALVCPYSKGLVYKPAADSSFRLLRNHYCILSCSSRSRLCSMRNRLVPANGWKGKVDWGCVLIMKFVLIGIILITHLLTHATGSSFRRKNWCFKITLFLHYVSSGFMLSCISFLAHITFLLQALHILSLSISFDRVQASASHFFIRWSCGLECVPLSLCEIHTSFLMIWLLGGDTMLYNLVCCGVIIYWFWVENYTFFWNRAYWMSIDWVVSLLHASNLTRSVWVIVMYHLPRPFIQYR